jgi:hypothetical protein
MPLPRSDSRVRLGTIALVFVGLLHTAVPARTRDLPRELSDREFWALTERLSEPGASFRSNSGSPDNLLSNENSVSTVAAALGGLVKPGGVYLGVGPEQNFTYIAAMRPRIAFITDIRRGNLHLHLVYKAVFEMSSDRMEFIARLFSRERPAGLAAGSTAAALMSAGRRAAPVTEAGYASNLKAITDHLTKIRMFPLGADDLAGIDYVYRNFHRFGPAIYYTASIGGRQGSNTYAAIMAARDAATGAERTYLANEDNFTFVKRLQSRNLIVPVVGNFAGPKALRTIGAFLRDAGAVATAFYVSNVEMYLQRDGLLPVFCANVAALPVDADSIFIRPDAGRGRTFASIAVETAGCRSQGARPARE